MDKGKRLEEHIKKVLKKNNIYFHRFYDARSGVFVKQPADFFVYNNKQLYYIECKETISYNNISLHKFRPYQLKEARDASKNGIIYLVIVDFNGIIMVGNLETMLKNRTNNTLYFEQFTQNFDSFINEMV